MPGKNIVKSSWDWIEDHPVKTGVVACILFLVFPPLFIIVGAIYTVVVLAAVIFSVLSGGHDTRPDYDPGYHDE